MPKVDGICGSLPKNVREMFANKSRKQDRPPIRHNIEKKFFKPYSTSSRNTVAELTVNAMRAVEVGKRFYALKNSDVVDNAGVKIKVGK